MKWHEMSTKARHKAIILAVIVAIGIAALLWPTGSIRMRPKPKPRPFPMRNAPLPGQRPAAGRESYAGGAAAAPPLSTPPAWPASPVRRDGPMLGKWETGSIAPTKRGLCSLSVEINRKPGEPDQYAGAATLGCVAIPAPGARVDMNLPAMIARASPLFANMSGTWDKEAIVFRIDKLINAGECGWTGFSVSRFGSDSLAAEFQDSCGGGAMVLRRPR